MEKITILAPAKINLFLRVGARREDGYHDIETVMQTVTLFDRLEVCKNEPEAESVIDVRCRDFMAPDGAGNIVFRAAAAFFAAAARSTFTRAACGWMLQVSRYFFSSLSAFSAFTSWTINVAMSRAQPTVTATSATLNTHLHRPGRR